MVKRNQIVSIMGPSGSGKSTLLNILGLLDTFEKGEFLLSGIDVKNLSESNSQAIRLNKIGFVFQTFNLIQTLTVQQNIELPMALLHISQIKQHQKAKELMNLLGIYAKAKKYPYQLSIGEQQRVAIARALVNDPTILLCDEPTGNLDAENTNIILEYLKNLKSQIDTTILIVSHNLKHRNICEKNYILENGLLEKL